MPAPNLHSQFCKKALFKANKTKPNHKDWLLISNSFPTSPYIARNSHRQTVYKAVIEKALQCSLKAELWRVVTPRSTDRDGRVSPLPQAFALFSLWFPLIRISSAFSWCPECSKSTFSYMKAKLNHTVILHYNLSSWILLQGKYLNN